MADQAITALPKKTYSGSSQIASTDYLLGIDSAEGYQMLIQDLGEYIINRATASLAGSTQTLASAISALNSKLTLTGEYNSSESFSSAETLGSKLDALLNAQGSFVIGCYRLSCTASFGVFQNGYDYYVQMARASSLNFVMAEFTPIDNALIKILGKRRVEGWSFELAPSRTEINTLNSNLSSLYCREYSYASGTSYKDAVADVISKLGNTIARYWVIITIGTSRHSLMIIKDGTQWSNGILTSYASSGTEVYFVSSRAAAQSTETVVYLRKLLTGDLE